ncbi:MAG: hypothetical protein WCV67_02975 [Victivallaceae bacterium]|jgi:DNA replication protein DnaC
MNKLYDQKIEAMLEERELERLAVPARGSVVEHVCQCSRVTAVRLTGETESVRRTEWLSLTRAGNFIKCKECGEAAEAAERAHWNAVQHRIAVKEGTVADLKLTAAEQKIKQAGFPVAMTKWDAKLAKPEGRELHQWISAHREENLWIADRNDVCKTRAVCSHGAHILGLGISVKYFDALMLVTHYVGLRQNDNLDSEKFIRGCAARLVIIDDLGQGGKVSSTAGEILFKLLDQQINNNDLFWLTANMSAKEVGALFDYWNTANGFVSRIERAVRKSGTWSERDNSG